MEWTQYAAFVKKEWLINWRAKENFVSTVLFCITILMVFHFALPQHKTEYLAGIYWVTFFFGGIISTNRSITQELRNGCFEAVLISPVSRLCLLFGKITSSLIFMLLLHVCLAIVFSFFFEPRLLENIAVFFVLALLTTIGFSTLATLLSTLVAELRFQEILLPLLLFPLLIPVFLAAIKLSEDIFQQKVIGLLYSDWLKLLVAYDLIFFTAAYLTYEFVIGD